MFRMVGIVVCAALAGCSDYRLAGGMKGSDPAAGGASAPDTEPDGELPARPNADDSRLPSPGSADTGGADLDPPAADTGVPAIDTDVPADTGSPPEDTGAPPIDTGVPADAGSPPVDTGAPPVDTDVPPVDTGTPPADTGAPPDDTGVPPDDTGVPPDETDAPPEDTDTPPDDTDVPPAYVPPPPAYGCTGTVGYWRNHPEEWAVSSLELGGRVYDEAGLVDLLDAPTRGDASLSLAHQLISAKLAIAAGADDTGVAEIVAEADAWLAAYDAWLPFGSAVTSEDAATATDLAALLEAWNNGAAHC
jgi:hypothetical protein